MSFGDLTSYFGYQAFLAEKITLCYLKLIGLLRDRVSRIKNGIPMHLLIIQLDLD